MRVGEITTPNNVCPIVRVLPGETGASGVGTRPKHPFPFPPTHLLIDGSRDEYALRHFPLAPSCGLRMLYLTPEDSIKGMGSFKINITTRRKV
ncbi:hypothetical protein CEXT_237181 [Caerostris extrusa]|uniref:Uncharacterized protein n=1 Tax=Caerostris extrusa TaxID=172846 RepID=A0AAV4U164_CAEEX|nr:hypothetical protein CEXT_237181 [Caerostris extrusa]